MLSNDTEPVTHGIPVDSGARAPERAVGVVKNSAVISLFNGLGFASALLIDIVVAARFGLSQETDAFFVAFAIPQLLASVLLVAMNVALVPIFSTVLAEEGKRGLWYVSSNLANLGLLAGGALGVIGAAGSPLFVPLLGAGFDAPTQRLAVSLSVVVFLTVIPLGAVEVLKAASNSLQKFAVPAATALIRNLVTFVIVVLLSRQLGIRALALGYVLGTWAQLFLMAGALFAGGFRYHRVLRAREPWTLKALRQVRPPMAGAVLGQSNILLERFLGSFLPPGVVSALTYARRILRAVDSMFLGSISTALLPRLSTQYARSDRQGFQRSLSLGLRLVAVVSIPASAGIIALSTPTVQFLFQRGAFDRGMTDTIAQLLILYVLGIPAAALFQILVTSYYATGDTQTPFYIRAGMLALNALLDTVLFFLWGAEGLPVGLSLTRLIAVGFVGWLLHRHRVGGFGLETTLFMTKVGLAGVVTGTTMSCLHGMILDVYRGGGTLQVGLRLGASVLAGAAAYALLLYVFRVEGIAQAFSLVRSRLRLPGKREPRG